MSSYSTPMRSLTPARQSPGMDANASRAQQQQHRATVAAVQQQLRANVAVQQQASGPVAILWDIENCPVPGEVNAEDVAGNIRIALRDHPSHVGAVTMFSAYGDFNRFPRKVREGCQRTGVNLIDVPNGKKDAADKAILVDMFLFALDNPPPSTIFLVTGDVDFAPALHKLGQRGYVVVLVIPDGVAVSSALRGAGRYVWDWPSLCRGEGLVPAQKVQSRASNSMYPVEDRNQIRVPSNIYPVSRYQEGQTEFSSGHCPGEELDPQNDDDEDVDGEEILAWPRGTGNVYSVASGHSYSQVHATSVDHGHQQYGVPQGSRTIPGAVNRNATSVPTSLRNQGSGGYSSRSMFPTPENNHALTSAVQSAGLVSELSSLSDSPEPASPSSWVQPGDLLGLKRQLVMLLTLNQGKMMLVKVPAEYQKQFGRPLYLAEYNVPKLVHLIEKMKDTLVIKGDGTSKTLHLVKKEPRVANKYKLSAGRASAPKYDKDRDTSEDSDPEGAVVTVKEVEKETKKVEFIAADAMSRRHLMDMDMDETIVVKPTLPLDWDYVSDAKGGKDISKSECLNDAGEDDVKVEDYVEDVRLAVFKQELQELLVLYSCNINIKRFPKVYQKRYARALDLQALGADSLQSLFKKVKDVAVLKERVVKEDPLTNELVVSSAV